MTWRFGHSVTMYIPEIFSEYISLFFLTLQRLKPFPRFNVQMEIVHAVCVCVCFLSMTDTALNFHACPKWPPTTTNSTVWYIVVISDKREHSLTWSSFLIYVNDVWNADSYPSLCGILYFCATTPIHPPVPRTWPRCITQSNPLVIEGGHFWQAWIFSVVSVIMGRSEYELSWWPSHRIFTKGGTPFRRNTKLDLGGV